MGLSIKLSYYLIFTLMYTPSETISFFSLSQFFFHQAHTRLQFFGRRKQIRGIYLHIVV